MTTKECYEKIGSNYESVLSRFGNEALVKRFALKFLKDPSYAELKEALEAHDAERAFRAAHTLKGVCLNLGFDRLYETSAAREFDTSKLKRILQSLETGLFFCQIFVFII